tara:strand:- start:3168 stop:3932 length:765 start_codon:yes stop_codon:yes gene_type:complete
MFSLNLSNKYEMFNTNKKDKNSFDSFGINYEKLVFAKIIIILIIIFFTIKYNYDKTKKFYKIKGNAYIYLMQISIIILGLSTLFVLVKTVKSNFLSNIPIPILNILKRHHYYLLIIIFVIYFIFLGLIVEVFHGNSGKKINNVFKLVYSKKITYVFFIFIVWFLVSVTDKTSYTDSRLLDYVSYKKNNTKKEYNRRTLIFLDTGLNYILLILLIYFMLYESNDIKYKIKEKMNKKFGKKRSLVSIRDNPEKTVL